MTHRTKHELLKQSNDLNGAEFFMTPEEAANILAIPVEEVITGESDTDQLARAEINGQLRFLFNDVQEFIQKKIEEARRVRTEERKLTG